jgi:hypothetical protein
METHLEHHKEKMRVVLMAIHILPLFFDIRTFLDYILTESEIERERLLRICLYAWKGTEYDFSQYSFSRFPDDVLI